jgi:hypothetical protein
MPKILREKRGTLPIAATILLAATGWAAEPPDKAPFDGQWSLEFRVNTKPGGEEFTTRQGVSVSPYHLHFHAAIESLQFQDDRSVKVEARENTPLTISSTSRFGGVTLWDHQNHRGLLRAEGLGSGDRQNRTVKLTINWIYLEGTGFASDSFGTSSSYRGRTSDDGTSVTLTNEAGTRTLPIQMWKSTWELKAENIEQTEVSPDCLVETATYRARQTTRLTPLDPGGFSPPLPVIEEIELKQVRQLNLVPRG